MGREDYRNHIQEHASTLALHNFKDIREVDELILTLYSQYKYGVITATKKLAEEFANYVISIITTDEEIVIVAGSSDNLANPIFVLSEFIVQRLATFYKQRIHLTKVHRIIRHNEPYCSMDLDERTELIKNDELYIDTNLLRGRTVIVLDDIRITGAHERKMLSVLRPDFYIYLIEYQGVDYKIEDVLNHYSIKGVEDIYHHWRKNNIILQSRNVKYILKHFTEIRFAIILLEEVLNKAYLNNYNKIDNLKNHVLSLNNFLNS